MKSQLAQVVKNKQDTKNELSYLKNRYIAIIYGGLAKGDKIADIHKRLYDETINQKKSGYETDNKMLNYAYKSVSALKKQVNPVALDNIRVKYGVGVDLLSILAFDLVHKSKIEKNMYSLVVKKADENEGKSKDEILKKAVIDNLKDKKIFYLASWHKDSASDHRNYQGKIYITEKWESIDMPDSLKNAIKHYIRKHNVKTIEWVTGKPVWFITRPNCRHYFKELGIREVLEVSKRKLLNKYDMKTAIGDRQYLQTIKHAMNKEWYNDIRNAQLLLQSYKNRLEMHNMMYKEKPSKVLYDAIVKDKFLIKKWEKYIQERGGK